MNSHTAPLWVRRLRGALKSRTMLFSALLAFLAPIEAGFHVFQGLLGAWYPVVFLLLGACVAWLRWVTNTDLSGKA